MENREPWNLQPGTWNLQPATRQPGNPVTNYD
jgi:hypothetical protein